MFAGLPAGGRILISGISLGIRGPAPCPFPAHYFAWWTRLPVWERAHPGRRPLRPLSLLFGGGAGGEVSISLYSSRQCDVSFPYRGSGEKAVKGYSEGLDDVPRRRDVVECL